MRSNLCFLQVPARRRHRVAPGSGRAEDATPVCKQLIQQTDACSRDLEPRDLHRFAHVSNDSEVTQKVLEDCEGISQCVARPANPHTWAISQLRSCTRAELHSAFPLPQPPLVYSLSTHASKKVKVQLQLTVCPRVEFVSREHHGIKR